VRFNCEVSGVHVSPARLLSAEISAALVFATVEVPAATSSNLCHVLQPISHLLQHFGFVSGFVNPIFGIHTPKACPCDVVSIPSRVRHAPKVSAQVYLKRTGSS
jgi:hypothetical protein